MRTFDCLYPGAEQNQENAFTFHAKPEFCYFCCLFFVRYSGWYILTMLWQKAGSRSAQRHNPGGLSHRWNCWNSESNLLCRPQFEPLRLKPCAPVCVFVQICGVICEERIKQTSLWSMINKMRPRLTAAQYLMSLATDYRIPPEKPS